MCLQEFIDYLKINLTCPADRFKCLCYLESLRPCLSRVESVDMNYAMGMVDRWIAVGIFSGSESISNERKWMPLDEQDGTSTKRPACCDDVTETCVKRQRV
jgi:hypothetical protein